MADSRHLEKNEESQYLRNSLTYFDKIRTVMRLGSLDPDSQ